MTAENAILTVLGGGKNPLASRLYPFQKFRSFPICARTWMERWMQHNYFVEALAKARTRQSWKEEPSTASTTDSCTGTKSLHSMTSSARADKPGGIAAELIEFQSINDDCTIVKMIRWLESALAHWIQNAQTVFDIRTSRDQRRN